MTVYYAHCVSIYDTPQETRDVETLTRLGFEVYNPNNPEAVEHVEILRRAGADYMDFFRVLVQGFDALAFRALPDGYIPAGVAKEIQWALDAGRPVIELPASILRRTLPLEQTREYLRAVGQR